MCGYSKLCYTRKGEILELNVVMKSIPRCERVVIEVNRHVGEGITKVMRSQVWC